MAKLLFRLGSGAYRRRVAVVLVWLVAILGAGVGALTLGGKTSNAFSIPGRSRPLPCSSSRISSVPQPTARRREWSSKPRPARS